MTRDEAIKTICNNWPDERYTMLRQALTVAVAALSTPAPVALPPHPIATAPKDGTRVLLWRDGWEFAPISWWDGRVGGWQIDGSLHGLCSPPWATSTAEAMPTHWVPLPDHKDDDVPTACGLIKEWKR